MGTDISNELRNKTPVVIPEPEHTTAVMTRHAARETMVRDGQERIHQARDTQARVLQAQIDAATVSPTIVLDPQMPLRHAQLLNDIAQGQFDASQPVPVVLTDSEKIVESNAWRTHRERNASLLKHRGQA
jgi:hypothetical protein